MKTISATSTRFMCVQCKNKLTRKVVKLGDLGLGQEAGEMIAYMCDPNGMRLCGFALGVLEGRRGVREKT